MCPQTPKMDANLSSSREIIYDARHRRRCESCSCPKYGKCGGDGRIRDRCWVMPETKCAHGRTPPISSGQYSKFHVDILTALIQMSGNSTYLISRYSALVYLHSNLQAPMFRYRSKVPHPIEPSGLQTRVGN